MSENERHCPSVVKNADGDMRCAHGHQMVHYFYLQDARFEISQLKEELEMYKRFKPEMPPPRAVKDKEQFQITIVFGNFDGKEECKKYLKHIKHILSKTMGKWIIDIQQKGSFSR